MGINTDTAVDIAGRIRSAVMSGRTDRTRLRRMLSRKSVLLDAMSPGYKKKRIGDAAASLGLPRWLIKFTADMEKYAPNDSWRSIVNRYASSVDLSQHLNGNQAMSPYSWEIVRRRLISYTLTETAVNNYCRDHEFCAIVIDSMAGNAGRPSPSQLGMSIRLDRCLELLDNAGYSDADVIGNFRMSGSTKYRLEALAAALSVSSVIVVLFASMAGLLAGIGLAAVAITIFMYSEVKSVNKISGHFAAMAEIFAASIEQEDAVASLQNMYRNEY